MLLSEFLGVRGRNRKKAKAYINYEGYIMMYHPGHPRVRSNGYVLAHYYFWERYNNACLLSWSRIHHKDGNKLNMKKSNLVARMGNRYKKKIYHVIKESIST